MEVGGGGRTWGNNSSDNENIVKVRVRVSELRKTLQNEESKRPEKNPKC